MAGGHFNKLETFDPVTNQVGNSTIKLLFKSSKTVSKIIKNKMIVSMARNKRFCVNTSTAHGRINML